MKTKEIPEYQEFNIDGVKHINPEDAFMALQQPNTILIDVREECEADAEEIPLDGILYHPMSVIMDNFPTVQKDQNILLICVEGIRSTKVANLMKFQGYKSAVNVDGGLIRWKELGLPIRRNIVSEGGCGCGCGCG